MEKYVVDAIEDSEENFYYLNQYYKKKQDEKRMPLSFNVPLILENRNLGKAVKKAINDSSEFALSAKGKKSTDRTLSGKRFGSRFIFRLTY